MTKTVIFILISSLTAWCDSAPLGTSHTSLHTTQQDEVHLRNHEDPQNLTYAAADSYCRIHFFFANFSIIGLGQFIISPKIPMRLGYCSGSCDSPYSLDTSDNTYVTYDVLIRQLANLDKVPLSEEQKKQFKKVCCVPVEYTSLRVVLVSRKGVRKKLWIDSIPIKCGCR